MTKAKSDDTVLVLRTCAADMTSYQGFKWKTRGVVTAPDWDPSPECGHGLHGLLWGEGAGHLLDWSDDAKWLVLKVPADSFVRIGSDKVKYPKGTVVYSGTRDGACDYLDAHGAADKAVVGSSRTAGDGGTATAPYGGTATAGYGGTATASDRGTATAGDGGTATAGYGGTATAGDGGTATAGYGGTATAGYRGTATAGYGGTATAGAEGTATAGDGGTATAGYGGTATASDRGTATAGYRGTATAGAEGTATAGDRGTATAGYGGTATAGYGGTATAGDGGCFSIKWWDATSSRYRVAWGYVGEDGIEPNVLYTLNDKHKIVRVKS